MIKVRLTNLLAWNRQPFLHVDLFCTISNRRHFSMVSRNVFFARDTDNETLTKKKLDTQTGKAPKNLERLARENSRQNIDKNNE